MAIKTRAELEQRFETGDFPTAQDFKDLMDSLWAKTETIPFQQLVVGEAELLCDATTTWDVAENGYFNARLELTENTTLDILNQPEGSYLMLVVKQDGVGGRTLTLPAGTKVGNAGAGVVVLSTTPGAIDTLSFYKSAFGQLMVFVRTFS